MAIKDFTLSKECLHELFEYRDGNLYWKIKPNIAIVEGAKAGTINHHGYVQVKLNKKTYQAHRLIFLMHFGYLPDMLDHIDCNRSNNKIENLRPTNNQNNQYNQKLNKKNKTGIKGVCFNKFTNKYLAQLRVNNKVYNIGHFDNLEDAAQKVMAFRTKSHGEFANHG